MDIDLDAMKTAIRAAASQEEPQASPVDAVYVTFKVTGEGEQGHPMDHILTRVDLDPDGRPTDQSLAVVMQRLRREIAAKAKGH